MGCLRARVLSVLLVAVSCSLFEYHPYEVRLKNHETNLNAKAIEALHLLPAGDTVTFLLLGDTQRSYDETEDFVKSANTKKADFVLLAGDVSDFGLDKEFQWVNEILSGLNKPYLAVIGNHDLSGAGEFIFHKMYGPVNDSFVFRDVRFILANTNSREYNFSGTVPNIPWLKDQLSLDTLQTVVVGHVPPFDGDFDPQLEEDFAHTLKESGNVKLSLFAHQHSYKDFTPYNDDMRYIVVANIAQRFYLKITLWKDGVETEKINY